MNRLERLAAIFIISSLVFSQGCIKRNLHIISDPAGAEVYFNEKKIGATPLDFDFMWYDIHKVRVEKEGCKPIEELISIRPPFYFWVPLDLFVELIPYVFWDRRELSYTLAPRKEQMEEKNE